jgi:glycosyltransferase involved in cell wall biosynthesis
MMASIPDPEGRFAIIIPVYNHGRSVEAVVREARALHLPIYVVDDGSTDEGPRILRRIPGIHLLRHRVNRGKGAALLTGMRAAAATAQWAITLDADGQHHPRDARALMAALTPGSRPIVVGVRTHMLDSGAPWTSRSGREFSNFWVRLAGGPRIKDSQSGFRIYPLAEVLNLGVRAMRYQFEVEVLVRAAWQRIPVIQVPVTVIYQKGSERVSHFRPFIDFMRNSATFSRLIFQRILNARPGRSRRGDARVSKAP